MRVQRLGGCDGNLARRRDLVAAAGRRVPAVERICVACAGPRWRRKRPVGRVVRHGLRRRGNASAVRVERYRVGVRRPLRVVRDVARHFRGRGYLRPAAGRRVPAFQSVASLRRRGQCADCGTAVDVPCRRRDGPSASVERDGTLRRCRRRCGLLFHSHCFRCAIRKVEHYGIRANSSVGIWRGFEAILR